MINNRYGAGSGEIWLDDVECQGSESSIGDCSHRRWGHHDCRHHEDVSITCINSSDTTTTATPSSRRGTTRRPCTNVMFWHVQAALLHLHVHLFEVIDDITDCHRLLHSIPSIVMFTKICKGLSILSVSLSQIYVILTDTWRVIILP